MFAIAAPCVASCCAACACEACRSVVSGIGRRSARIAYCGFFALSLIVSWILREVAAPFMEKIPWINHFHQTPDREWFETDAVLRVSLGNFIFFTIFAIIMVGVKDQKDPRDQLHHGGWMLKIVGWCMSIILMFFLPNGIVSFYETISRFGSGLFLLVQVVLLLDFVHEWNDKWVRKNELFWYIALFVISLACYVATFSFSGLLFHWFTPSGHDCELNTFLIVLNLILVFVFAIVALHPAVGGSILPASVLSLYCTYLCYNGLSSEPRDYECNGPQRQSNTVPTGTLALGLFTTVLSVVYSAVRAGSSTTFLAESSSSNADKPLLPLNKVDDQDDEKKDEARPVKYSYAFFHIIFSLASMYSAMILTGWSTSVGGSGKLVDVGWPSVWVRIVTAWATAALYMWSLVAPVLFPDREF
ncbi:serine incorporator 3-like [Macadamia integrifolia]|uniref:serine incorporator 3-like n=1 Tax=Macadamia integrifolia TaxID=60698 RepID=UPI001C4E3B91|nr:serine incorporator 3-like [Macadamia integrifolia]